MVWNKRNTERRHRRSSNNLFSNQRWGTVSTGDCESSSGSNRRQSRNRNYSTGYQHYLLIGLLAVSPVYANEDPKVQNTSNPVAAATGNVTNQAVQVLQGPFPVATFGAGISCPGPSLNISQFTTGNSNLSRDPGSYQSYTGNIGVTVGVSIPLDAEIQDLCKQRVRTAIDRQQIEADKARLDFELVRLLKCGEAKQMGVHFHPNSPYASICADIIVINHTPQPVTPPNID